VGISDDQLHALEPARLERAQERGPERPILAVTDGEAEDLAAPVAAPPGRHDHGLGDDPPVHSGLAVGGVHEDVGEALAGQRAVPEGRHLAVQVAADAGDLALADAAVSPQGADQVVDLAGAHPVQVGLHHHREQRLVDPAAALQQAGEKRPGPQLGDAQLQLPGRGRQQARAVAVALGRPLRRPLVWGSADHGRELGLDEGLVDGLGGLADAVVDLRRLACVQDLQQCRLVKGHRALCPFASTIGLVSLTIARWPLQSQHLRRRSSATYTTQWDATRATCDNGG
jgi:hypothetical protein